jgi:colanic acid/amylovoran biosynthesis glycosyltransferase
MRKLLIFVCLIFCVRMQALRILILTEKFPHAPRAYINNQILGLLQAGHEVFVLAEEKGESCSVFEQHNLEKITFYNELPEKLHSFDIIYAQFGYQGIKALNLIKRGIIQGKLVVSFRGADTTKELWENPHCYDQLFQEAYLCLANCEYFKNIIIDNGCSPLKAKVLYSGVDTKRFTFIKKKCVKPHETLRMVSVARLISFKGLEYAIQASFELKKKIPNFLYEIIGDGKLKDRLQQLIDDLGLQEQVKLLGYKTQKEIENKLKKAHLFLHTPITTIYHEKDAIPNVVKEALLTGVPVIVTDHGGNTELVKHEKTGIVVSEKDSTEIYKAIVIFIKNQEKYFLMAQEGAKRVREKFSKEITNQQLLSLLEAIS